MVDVSQSKKGSNILRLGKMLFLGFKSLPNSLPFKILSTPRPFFETNFPSDFAPEV